MKISVVTVCYNSVDTIEKTMLSVLNQTYPDVEYIIIDGGSTDGTVDIIKKYSDKLAYWISEPDKGIYDAMNKGIAVATGDYINFMNSGDIFTTKDTINKIIPKLKESPTVLHGDIIKKTCYGDLHLSPPPLNVMQERDPIFHQSAFINGEEMRLLQYDTSFKIAGDYKFFSELYKQNKTFLYIPEIIAIFDGSGISCTDDRTRLEEDFRVQSKELTVLRRIYINYKVYRGKVRNLFLRFFPGLAMRIKKKRRC